MCSVCCRKVFASNQLSYNCGKATSVYILVNWNLGSVGHKMQSVLPQAWLVLLYHLSLCLYDQRTLEWDKCLVDCHSVGLKWACALVLIAGRLLSDVPSQLALLSQVCTFHRPFESCLHHEGHETLLPGYGFHYSVTLRWLVRIIKKKKKMKKYHACPFFNIHWNGNQYCILVLQFG